jgi:hypothetical protein
MCAPVTHYHLQQKEGGMSIGIISISIIIITCSAV